jgi:hypothetical protein
MMRVAVTSLVAPALILALVLPLALGGCRSATGPTTIQRADLTFEPALRASWPEGGGPVVQVDEAHNNYHTADGRYAPFARLLRRDGFVVRGLAERADEVSLGRGDVYVVANALAPDDPWRLPTASAFSEAEVAAIRDWVEGGGSLLLIADHMPFPGAVEELAAAFDVLFANGFLYDDDGQSVFDFARGAGLADHPITDGRDATERVEAVRVFTGQAFRADRAVEPLFTVASGRVRLPVEAWEFGPETPSIPAAGLLQGAVFRFGEGRVAVFGEAAMFSAQEQIAGEERYLMGMNAPEASGNAQFLLNVMHWLTGELDG